MTKDEIQALIAESLQNAGFLSKQEFGATAAMIRGLKESVEKAPNPLDVLVTAGLLEKQTDGTYAPKAAPASKKEQIPDWKTELDQLKEQLSAKDRQIASEKQQREQLELKSAVVSAFEKAGAVNAERDHVHVLNMVKRGEDGKFYVGRTNEFGAEEKIGLDVAFGEYLRSNPELLKAQTKTGSGTPSGSGSDKPVFSTTDYMADREKILSGKSEVKVTF